LVGTLVLLLFHKPHNIIHSPFELELMKVDGKREQRKWIFLLALLAEIDN
jgi:hypothetical protein